MPQIKSESSVEIEQVQRIEEQSVLSPDCFGPNNEVLQEEVTEAKKVTAEAKKEAAEAKKRIAELEVKLASMVPVSYAGDTAGTEPRPCL